VKYTLQVMSAAARWADGVPAHSQLNRCVPPLDRRNGAIIAEDVGCRRIEQKMLPSGRREGEPASGEDPEDVTVSEYDDIALHRTYFGNDTIDPCADLSRLFAAGAAISKNQPTRRSRVNLIRR